MLDINRVYYVCVVGDASLKAVARWANWNSMKVLTEQQVTLSSGAKAYRLEVEYGRDLQITRQMGGGGGLQLMNQLQCIGTVKHDAVLKDGMMRACYAVVPIL